MKPDILTVCILATTILASTRHVIGFLTSQTAAASPVVGPPSLSEQQTTRRLSAMVGAVGGGGGVGGVGADRDEDVVIQPRRHLDALERNVYDPGDDLLHALNAELSALVLPPAQDTESSEPEPQPEPDFANAVYNELEVANKFELLKKMEEDLRAEQELVDKSALLMKMLEDPTLDTLPLVYVEEDEPPAITAVANDDYPELMVNTPDVQSLALGQNKPKRSRYYRRYPWKRHNRNRGNYDPELRYACTPSKEDIFKLLVNLHENRKGNHSKTVNFCNRKRPAKAVFTNIRFLG